jgi:hypothetical protein
LIASKIGICGWVRRLGWQKINTKYCQNVTSPIIANGSFLHGLPRLTKINFKIQLKLTRKEKTKDNRLLRVAGNKVGKPKHNIKIHHFGGISRLGLASLRMFTGIMNSIDMYCNEFLVIT